MTNPVVQVKQFEITVPAGTPIANPQVTATIFDDGFTLEWVEIRMPPGPRGQVGVAITSSRVQLLPYTTGITRNWLRLNDEDLHWDFYDMPDTGDYGVIAYNIGNYPHTFQVRYGVSLSPVASTPNPAAGMPPAALFAHS